MINARIRHDKAKIVFNDQDAGFLAYDGSTLAQDHFDNARIFIDFDGEVFCLIARLEACAPNTP